LTFALCPALAAQWTVGIYMCADNGMNDLAYEDLAELQRIGSTSEVNVVVQVDNAARDSNPTCRRYLIGKNRRTLISDIGEVDMADTTTLVEFAAFLKARYAASNYLLVLWDHGNGWYPGQARTRSIFIDESHQAHVMGVAGGEMRAALRQARAKLGKRIAVLAFDACLMQMLEVGMEAREYCDYLLGSEGLVPATGFPYDDFMGLLTAQPTAAPTEFLPRMCRAYVEEYAGGDVCLSAVDLRQLDRVGPVLRATLADSLNPLDPGLAAARAAVQTFGPSEQRPPAPSDDHVDFLRLWELVPLPESGGLRSELTLLIAANQAVGDYGDARGLAAWFPDQYLQFKGRAAEYQRLQAADSTGWPSFLNRYYNRDDVKPTTPEVLSHRLGRRGDVRLWWSAGQDLAPVRYDLHEATGISDVLVDYCDTLANWNANGWTTDPRYVHSPGRAFFSGAGSNLDHRLVSARPLELPQGGLLSFYAYFSTRETQDSSGIHRDACRVEWSPDTVDWVALDSLYGSAQYWQEMRYLVPPCTGGTFLGLRFVSGPGATGVGVFVDDIKVQAFDTLRLVAEATPDTTAAVFNLARDSAGYSYFVTARDSFGSVSMVSQLYPVAVKTYAEPYTRPAPFSGACRLVLDFPGEKADVRVYTLSGTLVREWQDVDERVLLWDGTNQHGRELADGLYLVDVRGAGFHKLGKIARVKRGSARR
jgi:hypothetical protein